ncbi:hypothetical protein ACROYT_G027591 [Oculina patagonica]
MAEREMSSGEEETLSGDEEMMIEEEWFNEESDGEQEDRNKKLKTQGASTSGSTSASGASTSGSGTSQAISTSTNEEEEESYWDKLPPELKQIIQWMADGMYAHDRLDCTWLWPGNAFYHLSVMLKPCPACGLLFTHYASKIDAQGNMMGEPERLKLNESTLELVYHWDCLSGFEHELDPIEFHFPLDEDD